MMIDAPEAERPDVVLVPIGEAGDKVAIRLLAELRGGGIAADMALRGNMKKRMAKADASGARHAIIIGDSEVEAGAAQLKNLKSGEQQAVFFAALVEAIRQ
jgi:histidyl-tRNA synthetase